MDAMIPKETPFDRSRFARARVIRPAEAYETTFAAAEDVIIKKMARRLLSLICVRGILR